MYISANTEGAGLVLFPSPNPKVDLANCAQCLSSNTVVTANTICPFKVESVVELSELTQKAVLPRRSVAAAVTSYRDT